MATERKTVPIAHLVEVANRMLEHPDYDPATLQTRSIGYLMYRDPIRYPEEPAPTPETCRAFRAGVITLLEMMLSKTNTYHGYRELDPGVSVLPGVHPAQFIGMGASNLRRKYL